MRKKITVVGAGNVGATCAQELARRDYADVVLVDIIPNFPQGKALDINQAAAVLGYEPTMVGLERIRGDAQAPTSSSSRPAGRARPGMSRDDLVATNEAIVSAVTKEAVKHSPDAILVVVSNPLDAMCHVAKATSRFKKHRVVGMAGILDTARFSTFIAQELDVSVKDVTAVVLGGHGDQMVPVVSATNVGGVPLPELLPKARISKLVERTKVGGGELVGLLGTSAWYAPGAAAAQMVDSICLDEKRILPCTAYLEGEYGISGLYMGVPVKLGAGGRRGDREAAPDGGREEDAARVRRRGARGRRRPEEEVDGSRAHRPDRHRLRRVLRHRSRHRRVARRRGRERRHVRAAPGAPRARGGADRRPRRRRRRHERGGSRAPRRDGRGHVRRRGHPREQLGRTAMPSSRPEIDDAKLETARSAAARLDRPPHRSLPAAPGAQPAGANRHRDLVDGARADRQPRALEHRSGPASSAGRSRSRESSGRRASR